MRGSQAPTTIFYPAFLHWLISQRIIEHCAMGLGSSFPSVDRSPEMEERKEWINLVAVLLDVLPERFSPSPRPGGRLLLNLLGFQIPDIPDRQRGVGPWPCVTDAFHVESIRIHSQPTILHAFLCFITLLKRDCDQIRVLRFCFRFVEWNQASQQFFFSLNWKCSYLVELVNLYQLFVDWLCFREEEPLVLSCGGSFSEEGALSLWQRQSEGVSTLSVKPCP